MVQATQITSSSYSGPIPPPSILREFDELDNGRAAKMLDLADAQSRHRMHLEREVILGDNNRAWAGLWCAFTLGVLTTSIGGSLVAFGHDGAGATIAVSGAVGLVAAFFKGTNSRRMEREAKARAVK
jgi:uncharacterized membrane protein